MDFPHIEKKAAVSRVWNIAHRGASAYEPENTLRAFKRAFELKADIVEVDVRLSRDGRVVVIHDDTVDRTTNGKGYVKDMTLDELKRLNAGKGERIPTLQEVIDAIKGKMGLLIDVKAPPPIEKKLVKIVEENGMEEDTIIIVYSWSNRTAVKRVKELNPRIRTAALFNYPPIDLPLALRINADILHIGKHWLATKEIVDEAHQKGLFVIVGTTDEPKELERLVRMGVDGITTNDPGILDRVKSSIVL